MRNLVIARIREMMLEDPNIQLFYSVDFDKLESMSNAELLELFEDLVAEGLE